MDSCCSSPPRITFLCALRASVLFSFLKTANAFNCRSYFVNRVLVLLVLVFTNPPWSHDILGFAVERPSLTVR